MRGTKRGAFRKKGGKVVLAGARRVSQHRLPTSPLFSTRRDFASGEIWTLQGLRAHPTCSFSLPAHPPALTQARSNAERQVQPD